MGSTLWYVLKALEYLTVAHATPLDSGPLGHLDPCVAFGQRVDHRVVSPTF